MDHPKFIGLDPGVKGLIASIANTNTQPLLLCSYESQLLNNEQIKIIAELGNKGFYQFFGCNLGEEVKCVDSPLLREAIRQSFQRNEQITTSLQVKSKTAFLQISVTVSSFSRTNLLLSFNTNAINRNSPSFKCPSCKMEIGKLLENWAEVIPNFIFTSSNSGEVDYFNHSWFEYTGKKEEESMGWKWMNYLHPSDLTVQREAWINSIQSNKSYEAELQLQRNDGEYRWFLVRARPLFGENQTTVKWFGTWTDINDQKLVQEEKQKTIEKLAYSEEKFRGLFDSNIIGIITAKPNADISEANGAFLEMIGYPGTELKGEILNYKAITPLQWIETLVSNKNRTMIEGRCSPFEMEIIKSDGTLVAVFVGCARLKNNDTISFVLDITRRKKAEEEALNASEAKSVFIANVSHELRTPLNAIIGMMEFFADTDLNDIQKEYVSVVRRSTEKLKHLINDILDFSEISANKSVAVVEAVQFSISKLLEDVIELMGEQANTKCINLLLVTHINYDSLIGDSKMLKQILLNLIANAIKFTEKGYVEVEATSIGENEEAEKIIFQVKDTGIGISKDDQQKLFKPFSQIDSSLTKRFSGTGLGLVMSKILAARLGGKLEIESSPGSGSVFSCTFVFKKHKIQVNTITEIVDCKAIVMINFHLLKKSVISFLSMDWKEANNSQEAIELLNKWKGTRIFFITDSPSSLEFLETVMIENINVINIGNPSDIKLLNYKNVKVKFVAQPIVKSKIVKLFNASEQESVKSTSMNNNLILVAEDNDVNRKLVSRQLEKLGYKSGCAVNGLEALKILAESRSVYSLILMDCQMPEMDGITCTEVIRKQEKEQGLQRMPIVALTANAFPDFMKKCLDCGMDDFVAKPISLKILKETLEKWISK